MSEPVSVREGDFDWVSVSVLVVEGEAPVCVRSGVGDAETVRSAVEEGVSTRVAVDDSDSVCVRV